MNLKIHDIISFIFSLFNQLSLLTPEAKSDPYSAYPTQAAIWKKFNAIFTAMYGLVSYKPAFVAYYKEALLEFYNDNIQYIEIRSTIPQVFISKDKYDVSKMG